MMDFSQAKQVILSFLQANSRATNTQLIELIGGNRTLFESVKEDLIINDLAEDKKGAGLLYIGSVSEESLSQPLLQETSGKLQKPDIKSFKIFISYGRKDAEDLANRLLADLKAQGHDVWLDKEQIRTGRSWEDQIEKAILSSDLFISLLTPHAVRRPDGICLDEISMARYNNRRIIPIMAINCRPPLGIYRLDWLDMKDWTNPLNYEKTLEKIIKLFQDSGDEVECLHSHIFSLLKPIDFKLDIYRHVKGFVGREWILEDIKLWVNIQQGKVLFITGNPGTGKSALMSKLIHVMPQVGAYHFCIAKFESSLIPEKFLHSIASQLSTQLPEYREILSELNLQSIAYQETGVLIKQLLIDPLSQIQQEDPIVIIVDALDEALYYGNENIVKLLFNWLDEFPSWVKLIITSRKVPEILGMFDFYKPYEIDVSKDENKDDIKRYAIEMLSEKFGASEETEKISVLAEKITAQSEGIFLYAKTLIQNLLAGNITKNEINSFRSGLSGLYQTNFKRLFNSDEKFDKVRLLLEIILASYKPLTADELALFQSADISSIRKQLIILAEFIPENEDTYSVFHKSLSDWLLGISTPNHQYMCDLKEGHSIIADVLMKDFKANNLIEYLVQYLPKHLYYAGRLEEMQMVLNNIIYIEARCAIHQVYSLIGDFKLYLSETFGQKSNENKQSTDQLWDKGRHRYETELFTSTLTIDKITGAILDFLYKQAGLIQLFGNVPGFVQQQMNNEGIVPAIIQEKSETLQLANSFLLANQFRKKFDPFPYITKVLYEHKLGISDLSVSSDEQWLVSASFDRTVRLWNLFNGECHKMLKFDTIVESVVMTPDASIIAIAGLIADFSILLYDRSLEKCMATLKGHSNRIVMMRISQNGRLVSCSSDHSFICWDINTRAILYRRQYSIKVLACSISTDGSTIAVSTGDNCIEVWNIDLEILVLCIRHDKGEVRSILLSHDAKELIVGGGEDKQTEIWDLSSQKLKYKIAGHGILTYCLALNNKKTLLITAGTDRFLNVWDFGTGKILKEFESHIRVTRRIAVTGDMQNVITGGGWNSDHNIRLLDVIRGIGLSKKDFYTLSVTAVYYFEGQGYILGINRRAVFSISIKSGEKKILKEKLAIQTSLRLEEEVFLSLQDGSVISFNAITMEWKPVLRHSESITALFKLDEDSWIFGDLKGGVLLHKQGKTKFYNSNSSTNIKEIFQCGNYIVALDSEDHFIYIDNKSREISNHFKHNARITSNISFNKDHIFFGDSKGDLIAYNFCDQSLTILPAAHKFAITSVLYHEKFDRLISGCSSGYISIRRPDTLTAMQEVKAHASSVNFLKLYQEMTFLSVSGNYYSDAGITGNETKETTMKMWNVFTGECMSVFASDEIITATMVDDSGKIAIGQRDGAILLFNPHSAQLIEKES